ncbi:UV-endonuclease UvdE [Sphaerulina musiva SO2202]|uniref:UV-endonuclease UvdE n=1 Tax=Sphaerulina musiva (strain SO2202) TaxID=692275 RepID=N1QML1_SPHMS|nr:UV-endonuclease UvdE [Sphaerulina musiva SO2202]EMF17208.1 UV-endonuclease UvdE [Sphaerulina musiva SO2202]
MPAAKRKRSVIAAKPISSGVEPAAPSKRRASARTAAAATITDPNHNGDVVDAPDALRASPDGDVDQKIAPSPVGSETNGSKAESPLSDLPETLEPPKTKLKTGGKTQKVATEGESQRHTRTDSGDPEAGEDDASAADPEEIKEALARPPPVNSDYLPLPWKGRLGYCCLNTYLRNSNPPVFSSRTCRIQSILEHRHPLQNPAELEHATKNRPDVQKPADVALGQKYVQDLGLANVRDIIKMVRWNDRYNIKFFRLSSEMFPFASHPEYGYKLASFASDALAEAGKVIAELGHRVTTHPGQFTQLGSPRKSVIDNAIRDLEYHDELLSLLKLPPQMDRDAVMVLHMGGLFEGKTETLQRFRENYATLKQSIKNRLVLENDDVIWSVHDLLPVCEELNIPQVLDYHHHNIIFDSERIREGTKDIMDLYPRISATWSRKGIKQKMHYSEPTPEAITGRQRRKHNPRVATLPPCAPDMDLMIEAKDKEQAVFELMRTFKLPGYDSFNDMLPYTRNDDNKMALQALARKKKTDADPIQMINEDDCGMGGPEGRVYWPPTMESWLRPKKKEIKKKPSTGPTEKSKKDAAALYAAKEAEKKATKDMVKEEEFVESDPEATPATKKARLAMKKKTQSDADKAAIKSQESKAKAADKAALAHAKATLKKTSKTKKKAPISSSSKTSDSEDGLETTGKTRPAVSRASSRRAVKVKKVSYNEDDMEE